jgi:demethylmenaquinone methyltransferase/2-methoxy-6-polyprenyl-1,4-benzoquinol methylase
MQQLTPGEVRPYNQLDSKKKQVSGMFDNIAPWYDFLNHFLSLGVDLYWRRKTIASLKRNPPVDILDVATGTADLAIEAARQFPAARITGIDISHEMLEIGRKKLPGRKLDRRITLLSGDSENISFPNDSFDAVTVAFGVRNFEDLSKGLLEMRRVLRPGGSLAVLEFSKPAAFPFKQLYNLYFRFALPLIGRLTSKDPKAYAYLYESVQAFPEGEQLAAILSKAGYKNISFRRFTLGICTLYSAYK